MTSVGDEAVSSVSSRAREATSSSSSHKAAGATLDVESTEELAMTLGAMATGAPLFAVWTSTNCLTQTQNEEPTKPETAEDSEKADNFTDATCQLLASCHNGVSERQLPPRGMERDTSFDAHSNFISA